MTATIERMPADFWDKWESVRAPDTRPAPVEVAEAETPRPERSLGRRAGRGFLRFVITLGVGVGATLAWQGYGDDARQLMASAYPEQLGWIAPQAATTALASPEAPATPASATPAVSAVDQQQLNALSLNLAAVRQSVEQLATQVASSQQQMSGDIAKLQASEQDILNKIATPPPRPAPAAPRKPAPPPVTATTAPPPPAPAATVR